MNTNSITKTKLPRALLIAVAATIFLIGMSLSTTAVHAEETYSVTVTYAPDATIPAGLGDTPLTLYKVGDHARSDDGKAYFRLAQQLSAVTLPTISPDNEKQWKEEWLGAAEKIKGLIADNGGTISDAEGNVYPKLTATLPAATKTYTFNGCSPGLYLVVGEGQKVDNYPDPGDVSYFYPQPMLVQVLQQNTGVGLKPNITPAVAKITVMKSWSDDGKEQFRPKEVTMRLIYTDEGKTETKDVKLPNKDGEWKETVSISPKQDNPSNWSIVELDETGNYDPQITSKTTVNSTTGETTINYMVENVYDRLKLKLIKDLPVYVQHADGKKVSSVFTFELNGYRLDEDGKEEVKPSFHKVVALEFDAAGTKDLEVPEIPRGLNRIEVKEIQHVNYSAEKDADDKTYVKDAKGPIDGVYTVSFKNNWNPKETHYEGSAINKYKYDGSNYVFDFTEGIVKTDNR